LGRGHQFDARDVEAGAAKFRIPLLPGQSFIEVFVPVDQPRQNH
jgi:hypothetical protein